MKVKVKLKKIGDRSLDRLEKYYEMDTDDMHRIINHIEVENEGYYVVWISMEEE